MQEECKLPRVICIYKWAEFNSADSSRVKRRCQLIIRLKANKCYQELLCYLSYYINFLNIKLCVWLQAPSRFHTFSTWFRTYTSSKLYLTLTVVIIVLMLIWLIVLSFAKQLFLIVCLVDCLVIRPIAFGFTKPLTLLVDSLGFWLFNRFWSIVWLFA